METLTICAIVGLIFLIIILLLIVLIINGCNKCCENCCKRNRKVEGEQPTAIKTVPNANIDDVKTVMDVVNTTAKIAHVIAKGAQSPETVVTNVAKNDLLKQNTTLKAKSKSLHQDGDVGIKQFNLNVNKKQDKLITETPKDTALSALQKNRQVTTPPSNQTSKCLTTRPDHTAIYIPLVAEILEPKNEIQPKSKKPKMTQHSAQPATTNQENDGTPIINISKSNASKDPKKKPKSKSAKSAKKHAPPSPSHSPSSSSSDNNNNNNDDERCKEIKQIATFGCNRQQSKDIRGQMKIVQEAKFGENHQ